MFVYFLRTETDFDNVVKLLKASCGFDLVVVKPELCFSKKFLRYTLFLAYKSFQAGTASAKKIELEWLCRITGTRNVSKALDFCLPERKKNSLVGVASVEKIPREILSLGGESVDVHEKALGKKAAVLFRVPKKLLAKYSLDDLLIEKAALASVS